MKKSSQVPASLIAVMATGLAASGCSQNSGQCVDAYGRQLPYSYCHGSTIYPGARWIPAPVQTGGFGGTGGGFGGSSGG